MMMPPAVTLYTHTLCPYAHRASLALVEKGLSPKEFERHVDLSAKPAWFLRACPRGLVPAMSLDDGDVITESLRIITVVDDVFDRGSLTSRVGPREEILDFVKDADAYGGFISSGLSFIGGGWSIRGVQPRSSVIDGLERNVARLDSLCASSGGDFLFGSSPSIADIAIYPFAERFQLAMREFQGYELGESQGAQAFVVWLAAMAARDSAKALRPNDKELLESWRRTGRLDYFDYETADRESP